MKGERERGRECRGRLGKERMGGMDRRREI